MPIWITDPEVLAARLADPPPRIGLDTEFIRERTYWPQLALVQIALDASATDGQDAVSSDGSVCDDRILLVDPLAPGITAALTPVLTDPRVLKIMHSASEDLVALKHSCGVVLQPLFDTQIGAAIAGVAAGIGYQRLVQEQLGVALAKGETRSDWLRRPLSAAQFDYAADDVRHLFALHDALADRLRSLDRGAWLAEDCARMVANAEHDELDRWPHLSLRTAQFFDRDGQHRLLRLLRWRDVYARDADRPRNWILDNELAAQLARDPLPDRDALQRQLDAHPKAPRKLGDTLWQALQTPLHDEADAPEPRVDERDKKDLRRLQDATAARSVELGLPDGVLASRRWLETLQDGQDWPGALSGWRRMQLEPALAPLLAGTASAGETAIG
ncbi:MAG: ribonuclease D [Luteimonas sp.]